MSASIATPDQAPPLAFASPDGRTWERDNDHQSAPRSPMMRALFDDAFASGTRAAFERVGAPLSHGESCTVQGWAYLRMVPAGVPDKAGPSKPPPTPVLKIASRLLPELRRRERIARDALEREVWMDDVRQWWAERPDWEARCRAHQETALDALDDLALAAAIETATADGIAMLRRHFELITPGVGIGLALVSAVELGLDPIEAAGSLRGASASTTAPRDHVAAIARALDATAAGTDVDLDEARRSSPEAAHLIDDYLAAYGWRLLGDDLDNPALAESPEVLTRSIRAARTRATLHATEDPIADLAGRVAAEPRAEFERLLRNAAAAYEVLDDNSSLTCWSLGVLRRFVLEAADRLVDRGALPDRDSVFLLGLDEVTAALRDTFEVAADDIADRRRRFQRERAADAPSFVGGAPAPPPDPSVFPRGLRTVTRAVGLYLGLRFPPEDQRADTGEVEVDGHVVATGHGVGSGSATGRAVVATDVHDALDRLEPGDVLVCPVTNPAFNVVFPIAAAVVTSAGGPLGHTAVTAREVGIPAVVGIGDLSVITDGVDIVVRSDPQ